MYLSFHNLEEKPFQTLTDSKFFYHCKQYSDAIAALKNGIQNKHGFFLLTGDNGTGKTTLVHYFANSLGPDVKIVKVSDSHYGCIDFYNIFAKSFNLNKEITTKPAFFVHLNFILKKAYSDNEKIVLIIDDAHKLNTDVLKELDNLSDIEINNKKMINILMVGENELDELIIQQSPDKISKKITVRCSLDPLTKKETAKYIKHHLESAGIKRKIFTSKAVREIYSFSRGNPCLINRICDRALVNGHSMGIKKIDAETIKECSGEHQTLQSDSGEQNKKHEKYRKQFKKPVIPKKINQLLKSPVLMVALIILSFTAGYFASKLDLKIPSRASIEDLAEKKYEYFIQKFNAAMAMYNIKPDKIENKKEVRLTNTSLVNTSDKKFIFNFKNNSDELTDEAFVLLNKIIKVYTSYPEAEIIIEGYTDSRGNYWQNKKLSKLRADVVKNYFVAYGIPESKIKVFGKGPENPLASNSSIEGRKKNRRVEVKIKIDGSA